MFLRSNAKKKLLFPHKVIASPTVPNLKVSSPLVPLEKVSTPIVPPVGFSTPTVEQFSTPTATIRQQREEQEAKKKSVKMAETVEALSQCCRSTWGKVERIRRALDAADGDHRKFSIHGLRLYAKNVDLAYGEFNDFQNRIYLTDPGRRGEFEPSFIEFEELYEYTRIGLCELLQAYEDEEKAYLLAAANSKIGGNNSQPGSSGTTSVVFPPTIVLQQTALPTFDGRYENWYKFKQMFRDVADKCTADSAATKLHYLDKALVGKAHGAIDQQIIRDNDYEGAWKSLTEQFENLPALISDTTARLLSLKVMSNESFSQLKSLIDDVEKCVSSLEYHGLKMDKMSEAIVISLTASKLDTSTRKAWESSVKRGKLPVYNDMMALLKNQLAILERCEKARPQSRSKGSNATMKPPPPSASLSKAHTATVSKSEDGCAICHADHVMDQCDAFKKLSANARYGKARQLGLCFLCLKRGHRTSDCRVTRKCSACSRNHHLLLHPEEKKEEETPGGVAATTSDVKTTEKPAAKEATPSTNCQVSCNLNEVTQQVLLATAIVYVYDGNGQRYFCRALLDSGAMASFMSQHLADVLNLRKEVADVPIRGITGMRASVKFKVRARVESRMTDYGFSLEYLVVPRVTGTLPTNPVDAERWPIPQNLNLADPRFYAPNRIDMLIGAEMFFELLQQGRIKMADELPVLQESVFGWLVSGRVVESASSSVQVCHATKAEPSDKELVNLLKRFWSVDEQKMEVTDSVEDDDCERHFVNTYQRDSSGRFVVRLPLRPNAANLGETRQQAEKRLRSLQRRLNTNAELKHDYEAFIDEYVALGHARIVDETPDADNYAYYLPHHCILKPESSSTKLRVVFDASAKSSTNLSLNDVMMIGPTVQPQLFDIMLRFRFVKYAFTADVPKMYRQIKVHDDDCRYQRILWYNGQDQPIVIELATVTYGTSAAPFLATRCLNQLAVEEQHNYPEASEKVLKCFYVDDVLTGADDLEEAKKLQRDLIALLAKGGFDLHKWCANDAALLEEIPEERREKQVDFETHNVNGIIKTLGLLWNPVEDEFVFQVKPPEKPKDLPTKRQILSEIARLFDPLGLLGPAMVIAKIVMQELWREGFDWDDVVKGEALDMWRKFSEELSELSALSVQRRVTVDGAERYEIMGFADASSKAYGCAVYLRGVKRDGTAVLTLLCGKSRVAPLKEEKRKPRNDNEPGELTIPRLELCAAKLLCEQSSRVVQAIEVKIDRVVLWSDSKIVLRWIDFLKPDAPVFVRNRIASIRQMTNDCGYEWRYIPSEMNPADPISRGVYPAALKTCDLWWRGPPFLQTAEFEDNWEEETQVQPHTEEPFVNAEIVTAVTVLENRPMETILKHSDFRKLQRIFAYVTRFVRNCRKPKADRRSGRLKIQDHRDSLLTLVRTVQLSTFGDEIDRLLKDESVKSKLGNFCPVFDPEERLLRVGGRIRKSDLPRDQRHPLILPDRHHLTEIIINALHREHLHVGQNGLLAILRQQFWPINAKRSINRVLRKCVRCFRVNPKNVDLFMGDLPSFRVTAALAFMRTGVDYAGPLLLKQGRMKAPIKAYIALFVCMTTKAIHLELVSSLSTDSFLASLHRFVGRRGNVSEMYSDNGKNFIGANRQLKELRTLLESEMTRQGIENFCQIKGIAWSFNPPKAPHQGGLWEAGVKSAKFHLHRILKEAYLTYEEMSTLLVQIEAILNSRPLCQLSEDPKDYEALSPAHFLVGRELTAVAEPLYDQLKENTLSRYQLVQKRKQAFWRRWSNEYVTELQRRGKWIKNPTLIRNGQLVILKQDNTPPQTWPLGRVVDVHPGSDGVIRVVSVRTSTGTYKRPTTQIAVLPIEDDDQQKVETSSTGGVC